MGFNHINRRSLTARDLSSDWLTRAVMPLPQVHTGRDAPPTHFPPGRDRTGREKSLDRNSRSMGRNSRSMARNSRTRHDGPHLTGRARWSGSHGSCTMVRTSRAVDHYKASQQHRTRTKIRFTSLSSPRQDSNYPNNTSL
jgi:hypothetical protein